MSLGIILANDTKLGDQKWGIYGNGEIDCIYLQKKFNQTGMTQSICICLFIEQLYMAAQLMYSDSGWLTLKIHNVRIHVDPPSPA